MDKEERTITKETKGKVVFTIDNGKLVELRNRGKRKSIVIPSKFDSGTKITSIGRGVCKGKFGEITISNDIEKVEGDAFINSDIEKVIWSRGCKKIPEYCFAGSKIQSISNIENVEEVGEKAFYLAAHLKEFTWPDACKSIPTGCFACCWDMHKIHNMDHVVYIGEEAFKNGVISEIIWPSKCPIIPTRCFEDSRLCKISNVNAVTEIEEGAFKDCDIKKFNWPSECKTIPENCFTGSELEKISGIENVEEIGKYAFKLTFLETFKWPTKCKQVPMECFSGCCDLTSVSGLNDVEEIKSGAFRNSKIQSLEWPSKCKVIPAYCFSDSSLKHISNIENIHSIGKYAFFHTKIDEINLEDSTVVLIEYGAFAHTEGKVTLPFYMSQDTIKKEFEDEAFEEFNDFPSGCPW